MQVKLKKRCRVCGIEKRTRGPHREFYPHRGTCMTCYRAQKNRRAAQQRAAGKKPSLRPASHYATCLRCRRTLLLHEDNFPAEQDPRKRRCHDCIAEVRRKKAARIAKQEAQEKANREAMEVPKLQRLPRVWYPGSFLKE